VIEIEIVECGIVHLLLLLIAGHLLLLERPIIILTIGIEIDGPMTDTQTTGKRIPFMPS